MEDVMVNLDIQKDKERLDSLREGLKELEGAREKLLEDENVQEYVACESLLQETVNEIKSLSQKITEMVQKNCSHPVWYLLDKDTEPYEGRTYFKCRCVECGKVETGYARDFDTVIRNDVSYGEAVQKWSEFSHSFPDNDFYLNEKGKTFTKLMRSKKH